MGYFICFHQDYINFSAAQQQVRELKSGPRNAARPHPKQPRTPTAVGTLRNTFGPNLKRCIGATLSGQISSAESHVWPKSP